MDYTGSSVYLNSQVNSVAGQLLNGVFGNPHSINPSSAVTTKLVEDMRDELLEFFGADKEDYQLVFVRSATGGLQLLGESLPWDESSQFLHTISNHNSVLGIREYAFAKGAGFVGALTEDQVEEFLENPSNPNLVGKVLPPLLETKNRTSGCYNDNHKHVQPSYSLFAYPAQDNFAGVLYPLNWIDRVHALSTDEHKWLVLLDAAAYVPTHRLNLTAAPADFVAISFYKMFGMPTGVGAFIMSREATTALKRTYWGGGSVFTATSSMHWEVRHEGHARWEDGTLPFLNIMALRHGLDALEQLGGIDAVETHVNCVADHLATQLTALQHSNGSPMVRLYGRHLSKLGHKGQGGISNFLFLKPNGQVFSYKTASLELSDAGFHVREGCTCNPGACYASVGVTDEEVRDLAESRKGNFTDWEWIEVERDGKKVVLPLGSIRVSLGWMSRVNDVDALIGFILRNFRDRTNDTAPERLLKKYHDDKSTTTTFEDVVLGC